MGRILERHCLLRQHGDTVDKAPACTKDDLCWLVNGLYWGDGVPRCCSIGDHVSSLSLSSDSVLFIRLIPPKISKEQGLSLFPDKDAFVTCPINALAMTLAMQTFPVAALLNLASSSISVETDSTVTMIQTPLTDLLLRCEEDDDRADLEPTTATKRSRAAPLKLQSYFNRVLKGAVASQDKVNITVNRSSHSFRRGGAQHANGDPTLSAQWIFDRGNWNMTATSKAFAYVFNTTTEDKKVLKALSNWKSDDKPELPSLKVFDSVSRVRIRQVGRNLFASSTRFEDKSLNLESHAIDILTAKLIKHFQEVNDRYPMSPYVSRMVMCLV
ncbi:hypothetical protein PHMEG_00016806 [Phytophthora megakarya]|uniref:Uncharacterized protein n=1 Tax=Phytophthora megakarya TaxID=4795 RepID=A0A225VYZ3_9STRA|nr:hypothetical protein PHMEG_00016806 [Phytophthora megakarya]